MRDITFSYNYKYSFRWRVARSIQTIKPNFLHCLFFSGGVHWLVLTRGVVRWRTIIEIPFQTNLNLLFASFSLLHYDWWNNLSYKISKYFPPYSMVIFSLDEQSWLTKKNISIYYYYYYIQNCNHNRIQFSIQYSGFFINIIPDSVRKGMLDSIFAPKLAASQSQRREASHVVFAPAATLAAAAIVSAMGNNSIQCSTLQWYCHLWPMRAQWILCP